MRVRANARSVHECERKRIIEKKRSFSPTLRIIYHLWYTIPYSTTPKNNHHHLDKNMRSITFLFAFVASAGAFTAQPQARPLTSLASSMDKSYTVSSGMTEHEIPFYIDNLTQENFAATLEMLEPLLTNECVGEICEDYLAQLQDKAEQLGQKLPAGYGATHH